MPRTTHGHSSIDGRRRPSLTYASWMAMKARCTYPKHPKFYLYGGRGVTICERWLTFENFLADMGERPPGMSLDRIAGELGYEPGNCRWATPVVQGNNRRDRRRLTFAGETLTIQAWAHRLGIGLSTLRQRLANGWSEEKALSTPLDVRQSHGGSR